MFLDLPRGREKDNFLKEYHKAMAHTIFRSFCDAYPKSKLVFEDVTFRERLALLCAHWTIGMRPQKLRRIVDSWTARPLGGDVMHAQNVRRVSNLLHSSGDTKKVTKKKDSTLIKRKDKQIRVQHSLDHSPLVRHYLEMRVKLGSEYLSPFGCKISLTQEVSQPLWVTAVHSTYNLICCGSTLL